MVPFEIQTVIFNGEILNDDDTCKKKNITKKAELQLQIKSAGGCFEGNTLMAVTH